jgi:hypothetical protein
MDDPEALITAGVAQLVERDAHQLPDLTLLTSTEQLLTLVNQLHGVIATQLQVIDIRDATVGEYGRQTRGWLVEELHLGRQEASRQLAVARALPTCPTVRDALAAGTISLDHARVIVTGVQKAPLEIRDVVEKELVTAAESCDPTELARFVRELRSRLGAEEDAEAAAQRRYESRWLRLTPTFDGMHAVDGMLDPASAAVIKAALAPLLERTGDDDTRTGGQRLADGLVTIAEVAMHSGGLPEHGGEKPQVIVTIPWPSLQAVNGAVLNGADGLASMNGLPVTPETARMVACDAEILPAVLGGDGEVLDLGRRQAIWSPAQRRALRLQETGCRFIGCQAGLERCRIHHIQHWAHGGKTDLANAVHLCKFHHWLVHHSNWQISKDRHNKVQVWRT